MRAAAWSQIEIGDLNHAQLAFAGRLFTQRQRRCLFGRDLANPDRTTLPDDLICEIGGLIDWLVARIMKPDGNRESVFEHEKAARGRVDKLNEHRVQDVLSGVLMHVTEPPQPIDMTPNSLADFRNRSLDDMQHASFFSVDA